MHKIKTKKKKNKKFTVTTPNVRKYKRKNYEKKKNK